MPTWTVSGTSGSEAVRFPKLPTLCPANLNIAEWSRRKGDITGPDTMFAYPYNFNGDIPYKNITLDTVLNYRELLPTSRPVKIKDVMDTESGRFCYKYT